MEILREHPGVFVPPNKGTAFFTRFYGQGLDWYEGFFARAGERQVIGEICEEYLSSPDALRRIREYSPNMRLICCLRNPYERAISAWRFYGRNGCQQPTLVSQAERNPQVFSYGFYGSQLEFVRSLFPDNQILIFLFEELASDAPNVARRLYEFIGADPSFTPPSLHQRVNVNGRARWRHLALLVHRIQVRTWGTSRTFSNLVGRLKGLRPLRRAVRAILYDEREQWSEWRNQFSQFPEHVIARYEREIGILERILNRDLSDWRSPAADTGRPAAGASIRSRDSVRHDNPLITKAQALEGGSGRIAQAPDAPRLPKIGLTQIVDAEPGAGKSTDN
jgi:hypothetical protein